MFVHRFNAPNFDLGVVDNLPSDMPVYQRKILVTLQVGAGTARTISRKGGLKLSTVRAGISHLRAAGRVIPSGNYRMTGGRRSTIWKAA